jgi:ubiquinone/menaquinone biosynthesis C-methylase UbiE
VRTDYEQLAARYDEDRAKYSVPPDDLIAELLEARPSLCVLDLGCGTGRWVLPQVDAFADRSVAWFGADPSPGMLAEARAKGLDSVVVAPAEGLPFGESTLDYVVSSYCFHHFTDKNRALDEIRRVLTPGGVFRIYNIEPAAAGDSWLYEFFPETVAIDAARFWPPARIAEALEARQFSVDVQLDTALEEVLASEALALAERRVASQLAMLDDAAFSRGLARLREAASTPGTIMESTRALLCLTARRA